MVGKGRFLDELHQRGQHQRQSPLGEKSAVPIVPEAVRHRDRRPFVGVWAVEIFAALDVPPPSVHEEVTVNGQRDVN